MKKVVLIFIISINAMASVSTDLRFLEENTPDRVKWINQEQAKFIKRYNETSIHRDIEKELKIIDSKPIILSRLLTSHSQDIEIKQTGFGKEFILTINDELIFGSHELDRHGYFQFNNINLSPNENYLSLSFYEKGNTEDYNFLMFNLITKKMIFQRKLFSSANSCVFVDDFHCLINSPDSRKGEYHLIEYDLNNSTAKEINLYDSFDEGDLFSLVKFKGEEKYKILFPDGKLFQNDNQSLSPNIAFSVDNHDIYQAYNNLSGSITKLSIEKVSLFENEMPKITLIKSFDNEIKYQIMKSGDALGLITTWGLVRKLRILNKSGDVLVEKLIPNDFRYSITNIDLSNKVYTLSISAGDKKEIKKVSFNDSDLLPKNSLWSFQGLDLEVKNFEVESKDGTLIPFQTIGIKNYPQNLRHAFVQVYGGFNIQGYLFSYRSLEQYYPFLKRGGIIVNTGVRGGNEYGSNWNLVAKKEKKIKTFEDVDAVASFLIEKGISIKEWISLFGSSNGGYVTATTGLLFSNHFGLIIPHAGVLDQLNKKVLDPDYTGWVREYLDEDIVGEKEKIPAISPLEIASSSVNIPFLILAEQNDTRVNPAHSYKLYYQLQKTNKAETFLYSMKNFGHYTQGYPVGYVASTRMWSMIWSTIFDSQK